MIRNREQLMGMSSEWMRHAKADLQRQVVNFMEAVGTDGAELAHALCISEDELNKIINGQGEISLSTFAKLLIATDNVIEIKPISETPFGGFHDGGFPSPDQMPRMPQMPPMGGRMPFGGQAIPPRQMPNRDSRGRFVRRDMEEDARNYNGMFRGANPQVREEGNVRGSRPFGNPHIDAATTENPTIGREMPNVPRRELVTTIVANEWDEEIDIVNSTSAELIEFLQGKGFTPNQFEHMMPRQTRQPQPQQPQHPRNSSEIDAIMDMMKEELERNPNLLDTVRKYIHE